MAIKGDPVTHQAISKGSRQIRLLRILGDASTEDVECSLDVYDIDTAPSYTAISYTWGLVTPVRRITINRARVIVRENCHTALQYACLHRHALSKYLWIDAICIDQENLLEKNHQVGLMAEIFEKADSVLVSLGSGHLPFDPELMQRTFVEQRWTEHEVLCARLLQVSRAPYWSRLWIVQEYLVAPKSRLYIALEDSLFGDTTLHNLLETIRQYQSKPRFTLNRELLQLKTCWIEILESNMACLSLERHNKIRAHAAKPGKLPLEHVLKTYGCYSCADPRDKVFGLLHLVQWPTADMEMRADYTKSVHEVVLDCLRCDISPMLLRDVLKLDFEDYPEIRSRLQSSEKDAVQTGALATSHDHPIGMLQSASAGRCDHRCTKNRTEMRRYIYARTRDVLKYRPHFSKDLRVKWFTSNINKSGQILSHVNFGLKIDGRCGRTDNEFPLVMFAPNTDVDMLEVATMWVPWLRHDVYALVRDAREAGVYSMVCQSELHHRVLLEGMLDPLEPRREYGSTLHGERRVESLATYWKRVHPQHISTFYGLILRGTDNALYMIVGPASEKPVNAIRCNAWLDQIDLEYGSSRFDHIVQARNFYRHQLYGVVDFELPIYTDPEDSIIAICEDHERLNTPYGLSEVYLTQGENRGVSKLS